MQKCREVLLDMVPDRRPLRFIRVVVHGDVDHQGIVGASSDTHSEKRNTSDHPPGYWTLVKNLADFLLDDLPVFRQGGGELVLWDAMNESLRAVELVLNLDAYVEVA